MVPRRENDAFLLIIKYGGAAEWLSAPVHIAILWEIQKCGATSLGISYIPESKRPLTPMFRKARPPINSYPAQNAFFVPTDNFQAAFAIDIFCRQKWILALITFEWRFFEVAPERLETITLFVYNCCSIANAGRRSLVFHRKYWKGKRVLIPMF